MNWFGGKEARDRPAAEGDPDRIAEVEQALEGIRPALQADGGDVRLVAVLDDEIQLQLEGACDGCGMAFYTVRQGIDPELRRLLPWVRRISVE